MERGRNENAKGNKEQSILENLIIKDEENRRMETQSSLDIKSSTIGRMSVLRRRYSDFINDSGGCCW